MDDWVKLASSLPVRHSRRMRCWLCDHENSMSITNMGKYYVGHCFRCKEKVSANPPEMTPQERRALQLASDAFIASDPSLPEDFTTSIPIEGLLWLTKGGLHVDDCKKYGFGYSKTLHRTVLPIWDDHGTLVGVQARNTGSAAGPKYLSQVSATFRPIFTSTQRGPAGNRAAYHAPDTSETVVLTEDILSAARVGKVNTAWSLLGTNLMSDVIAMLGKSKYGEVAVWMDDDEAGILARRKMLKQLGSVGINARAIVSDRDPKNHTLQEIKDLI